jgi:hypothetical protein
VVVTAQEVWVACLPYLAAEVGLYTFWDRGKVSSHGYICSNSIYSLITGSWELIT